MAKIVLESVDNDGIMSGLSEIHNLLLQAENRTKELEKYVISLSGEGDGKMPEITDHLSEDTLETYESVKSLEADIYAIRSNIYKAVFALKEARQPKKPE
jgi:phosphoheptose isomerase